MKNRQYTFIDLFAGCGGLSEGFYQEGFKSLLHLEFNRAACQTLKTRMRHYLYPEEDINRAVMCEDITQPGILNEISLRLESEVDIIIGGPPCQAFSSVGRAQDPDSMNYDPRNYLFENYLSILNNFKPKLFIFENVKGILSARPNGVKIFDLIIDEMNKTYKVLNTPNIILHNAVNYGVPQNRERVILIGVRKDIDLEPIEVYKAIKKTHYGDNDSANNGLQKFITVADAITDLPKLNPGDGENIINFVPTITNEYIKKIRDSKFDKLYNHVARTHNSLDRERYKLLSQNSWQLKDLEAVRPDLIHHDPKHFGNRYTVQEFNKPGRTIVAHLYKDGNLFIHPDSDQARTFTVREAARIQSFPDDFFFEGSRTEQYKQVGNAVPPLMARAFACAIKSVLEDM